MVSNKNSLLVVEDDIGIQNQLKWSLDDFKVFIADNREDAITAVRHHEPEIVLLDLGLPPDPGGATEGLATLAEILTIAPGTKVIVITGNDDRAHALEAIDIGAYDYYNKPIDAAALNQVVSRASVLHQLETENAKLQSKVGRSTLEGIIAVCEPMAKVCRDIEKLAPSDIATMLLGESGTGKELLARALHDLSPRHDQAMISINCAAIPDNLLESELFGYERGAFTGANKQTKGKLEYAHNGTIFLDEIGDLPLNLQPKLLRFLQEKTIERVGGRVEIPVNARVISATHKSLEDLIEQKLFREDLYYRLGEVTVEIPALRDRQTDVQILAKHFLTKFGKELNKTDKKFNTSAIRAIQNHDWPGNIRELENRIKRAIVMSDGKVIGSENLDIGETNDSELELNLKQVREKAERDAILNTLNNVDNNISKASKILGVSRPTLYDLMNKLGIKND